jgi:dTDP-4-amino-4,6-dideoxygalactose transaminase
MKKIQMVDLKGQYAPIKEVINASIQEVIDTATFINGPKVKEFQANLEAYLGVKHVIPCANGTDALQIAMMGLGLKPGDEVITSDFTFAATVEVIALLGLTPVLVDVCPNTFNINVEAVEKSITSKTKAIIPVHLFGQCANMEPLLDLAKKHNLFVIEDCAQSMGAEYTFSNGKRVKSGKMGDIAATSFFPSKNLGCYGDGGAIFTDNDDLAQLVRGIVNHGMYKRYHHDVVGVNSRLDSIQAAVLDAKLPNLDNYNKSRQYAAQKYTSKLGAVSGLQVPKLRANHNLELDSPMTHVYHQYTLKIKSGKRDALVAHLLDKGIPCGVYYPIPLHKQKAYLDDRYNDADFTVTNTLIDEVLSLPMHTELDDDQIDFITSTVIGFLNK